MIDLDAIEQAARAAQDKPAIFQTESIALAQFVTTANPAAILDLIARLRAAEALLASIPIAGQPMYHPDDPAGW